MHSYARYSGMAFQLIAAILLGVFVGQKLDAYWQFKHAYMTALCAILFLFAGLYLVLKDLLLPPKK